MRLVARPLAALALVMPAVAVMAPGSTATVSAASAPLAVVFDHAIAGTTTCHDGREFPQLYSSPAIGDLRHDGGREVVAAFPDGHVRVYDTSGNLLWERDTGDSVVASPTLADLDGTGALSVIVPSYSGAVSIWDANGSPRPGWPQHSQFGGYGQSIQPGFFSSAAVGDLFGDGRREIVASALDQHTYGWYANGSPLPGYPHLVLDSALGTPALADLEHRHQLDIVTPADSFATKGGTYYVFRPDGSTAWRQYIDEVPWSSPAIADFGDGNAVTVNGTGEYWHVVNNSTAGRYVTGFNQNGSVRAGWPSPTGGAVFDSPAVGDVLNNGSRDVVFQSDDGYIHVVDGNGAALPGTPFPSPFGTGQNPGFYHAGAVIAPVTTPGRNGFWIPTGTSLQGYMWNGSGFSNVATVALAHPSFSTPAVAQLADGSLALALTYDQGPDSCNAGGTWDIALYHLTSAGTVMPAGAWPTFHGNNLRSGSNLPLAPPPPPPAHGYWLVARDGGIFPFGNAAGYGSTGGIRLNQPIVGMSETPHGGGYWLVASDGGIFPFGNAPGYGSTGNIRLNQPIVGMAATPTGRGYWLVASDGGIFPFGDAGGYGSTGAIRLNQPIVGMAATPSGHGYWLVARDGGIFPFGDAGGYGSTGNIRLNQPIVGMAATPSGGGYWLVASDGGIFPFGDAQGYGSTGNIRLNQPIVGMSPTWDGHGYWLVASDGGIFPFGDAPGYGSTGGITLNQPIVGMSLSS